MKIIVEGIAISAFLLNLLAHLFFKNSIDIKDDMQLKFLALWLLVFSLRM
ncbi:hypothetical protein [uncultured Clostridium sp.]|nr:hypothetical protein [uncultured Clostridium sp.]